MELAEKILNGLDIPKPQRDFLLTLYPTILTVRGKVNFRNLSRYSDLSEKTYSRQFAKEFDAIGFNRQLIDEMIGLKSQRVLAFDPCFIPKAGKKTYGRDFFWNGCHNRAEKGLEISAFSIVDMERNTGFALSVRQTHPVPESSSVSSGEEKGREQKKGPASRSSKKKKGTSSKKKSRASTSSEETLIDAYLAHQGEVQPHLLDIEKHLVVDSYFAKKKWIDGVDGFGLHTVGKLRCDADMRDFYTGPKRETGSGRQKTYDGKVDWQDLRRFHDVTQPGWHRNLYPGAQSRLAQTHPTGSRLAGRARSGQAPLCPPLFHRYRLGCDDDLPVLQSALPDRISFSGQQAIHRSNRLPSPGCQPTPFPLQRLALHPQYRQSRTAAGAGGSRSHGLFNRQR